MCICCIRFNAKPCELPQLRRRDLTGEQTQASLVLWNTLKFILNHPLNRDRKFAALKRFLSWQVGSRLVPGSVAVPFVGRTRLLARPGMAGATGNVYCGLHEFEEMSFVLHALRPGDLFVDIGANIGSYSVIAAGACGADAIAIEPVPQAYQHLIDNVTLNGLDDRVTAINICIGERAGALRFSGHLDTVNHVLTDQEDSRHSLEVRVETLDAVLGDRVPRVMKIDVEGYEEPVLKGAARTLASERLAAIVIELNGSGRHYGFDDGEIHEQLQKYCFQPYRYAPLSRGLELLEGWNTLGTGNTIYIRDVEWATARVSQAERWHVLGHDL